MDDIDKHRLLELLRARVKADLTAITNSQQETQAGATHAEAKQEGDKDMRATETSYLARGLAQRVEELREAATKLAALRLRVFGPMDAIAMTALVTLEEEDTGQETVYFLAPAGGGLRLDIQGRRVSIVTSASPLGHALMGKRTDDEVEVKTPNGNKSMVVTQLR